MTARRPASAPKSAPAPKAAAAPAPVSAAATEGVAALCAKDRKLARYIERCGPYALEPSKLSSPFAALARSIVYQQLHGKAAATILARVVALFPGTFPTPEQLLAAPDEALRGAGLSRNKLLALRDLAAKTIDGTVPPLARLRRMSDDEIVEHLTAVRGIGRWTVEMMLIFRLGRPDVLPATDYGVRKGFSRVYGGEMPPPAALLEYGERWRPWRSVASWYLWRVSELPADALGTPPRAAAPSPARAPAPRAARGSAQRQRPPAVPRSEQPRAGRR